MRIVRAYNIENWACTLDARSMLPGLVRRLVHVTGRELRQVSFPAGEGVQRPGWDGVVVAETGTAFVPSGASLWEAGTGEDPEKKANGDFDKRVADPLGFAPADSTFIFVTPRKWTGKGVWIREKKAQGVWKDVLVYDSDSLEQWLETAAGVDAWFARYLGLRPPGVDDAENHWNGLSSLTQPALTPGVFLASRSKEAEHLARWVEGPPGELVIETRSPGEALDFLCACLASLDEPRRVALASRIILVETIEAWRDLAVHSSPLTLVAKPGLVIEPEEVANAVRRGHQVISSSASLARVRSEPIHLPRVYEYDLSEALKQAGFDEVEAARSARAAGGSCTVLKRHLARFFGQWRPQWAFGEDAHALTPFLWVGEWSEGSEADRAVVARLGGKSYEEMAAIATRLAKLDDAPLVRVLGTWRLASKEDAWMLAGEFAPEEQLRRFVAVAKEVLGEDDPRYELAAGERLYANVHGLLPKHSPLLKRSIGETLALLGSLAPTIGLPVDWHVAGRISGVVQAAIPPHAAWKRWASLNAVLPLLAEASPGDFLAAVERDLATEAPHLVELLRDEGSTIFSECMHSGLLWALEAIAWSREHLPRACGALVRLDERDPGGKWGNRPGASAVSILLPWHPQTTASVDERIQVLDYLTSRHPRGAWHLLLGLLPHAVSHTIPTQQPHWRDWATTWVPGVTNGEYWRQVDACAKRAIAGCGTDAERWCGILGALERLPSSVHEQLLSDLHSLVAAGLSQEERRRISNVLRDKVSRHRDHADADWSLPEETVAKFDAIQQAIDPTDPVHRHAWLFDQWPERHSRKRLESWDEWRAEMEERRRLAMEEVLQGGGWPDVLRLAKVVESPRTVGFVLAVTHGDTHLSQVLPVLLGQKDAYCHELAAGFVWGRYSKANWPWVDDLGFEGWSPLESARLFTVLPFERVAWERVERLGPAVAQTYWETVAPFSPELGVDDVQYALEKLLERRRAGHAVDLLAMALHRKVAVPSESLLRPLEQGLMLSGDEAKALARELSENGDSLFQELQKRGDVDETRLARLEFNYLALLDGLRGSPKTLHRMLGRDPAMFVDVLRAVFKKEGATGDEGDVPHPPENVVMQAYRLLESWKALPGQRDDGSVDAKALREWVEEARRLAAAAGRLDIADSKIGAVLSHAPADPDGTWPCEAARLLLDSICSPAMERGFGMGAYNSRGVCTRSPREGGGQERDLAEKYDSYAAAYQMQCPRTAAVLRQLAAQYRAEGRQEDEEAEWRD